MLNTYDVRVKISSKPGPGRLSPVFVPVLMGDVLHLRCSGSWLKVHFYQATRKKNSKKDYNEDTCMAILVDAVIITWLFNDRTRLVVSYAW